MVVPWKEGGVKEAEDAASFFSSTPTLFVMKMFSKIIPVPTNKE
jgi:hypothetical protein